MRNHRYTLCIVLACSFLAAGPAAVVYAGAYEWGGLGSRAQSMGGAFTGLADDWTAIYWNPAGLARLEGAGFGFEFFSPHVTVRDGDSLSNELPGNMETRYQIDTFAQYTGLEPTQFNRDEVTFHFYNPSGLGGYWQYDEITMGAGLYVPVGYYFDWEDTLSYGAGAIRASLFQELALMCGNFSIATRIAPCLSVGAGVEFIYGTIDYEARKTVADSGISDYTWDYESACDGTGFEGLFGVLVEVTDALSLGCVYRTGASIDLTGDADTELSLTGLAEDSGFTQRFRHPSTFGLGSAYEAAPNLVLTADWQRTNWSEFGIHVDYGTEGVALTDKDYSADWKDSNRYRAGVEYTPNDRWALRGGYYFDESPLPDKSISFSNIACVDRHNLTLGATYKWTDKWRLDFLGGYAWGTREVGGVRYEQTVALFGITVSYAF